MTPLWGCDVCGEADGLFTYMDHNKKAHMVCSDACMDKNKGEGRGTTPVLGGGRMVQSDEDAAISHHVGS